MFIIDFRNKKMTQYAFSVMNNSNVDVVNFYSRFTQYANNTSIYLKVRSNDDTYVDKIAIASEDVSINEDALVVKWVMGAVSTHCKKIDLQLQFEKDGDVIDQTGIVSLTLADTIDVDELIPVIYPHVLKHLQDQIDVLKLESVHSIGQSWNEKTLIVTLYNVNNEAIASVQVDFSEYAKIEEVKELTPKHQTNVAVILNPLTNINGRYLSAYGTQYDENVHCYQITKNGVALSEEEAKDYMEFMCGSRYLPKYNFQQPVNSYWLMADGTFLKPQFDVLVGMLLYEMTSPFALKTYVDEKIDEIEQRSDVVDVVGTYADLEAYDTSSLAPNSLIKVINDETHNHEITYYRWVVLDNIGSWVYVASEGAYYTTSQIDQMLLGYVATTGDQTVGGVKTFTDGIGLGNTVSISSNSYNGFNVSINNANVFTVYSAYTLANSLRPLVSDTYDIGSSSLYWKRAYISGDIYGVNYHESLDEIYTTINHKTEASANNEIKWSMLLTFSKSADTTFTFETAKTGCLNEYNAFITNSGNATITITLPSGVSIKTNDDNIVVSNNTFTLPSGTTVEINCVNNLCFAYNHNA